MRLVMRVLRYALSLGFALAAAWCAFRGMRHLFGFGSVQRASLSGVGPAIGYFAACVLCLLGAGEVYPKGEAPTALGAPTSRETDLPPSE